MSVAKNSVMPSIVRKLPTIAPCSPWVGSIAVTKPSPSCWAMTEPATSSAEMVNRAVTPSIAPMRISSTSITSAGPGAPGSM
jgi:hypothetical protein